MIDKEGNEGLMHYIHLLSRKYLESCHRFRTAQSPLLPSGVFRVEAISLIDVTITSHIQGKQAEEMLTIPGVFFDGLPVQQTFVSVTCGKLEQRMDQNCR